ncbi:dihydroxyacetone kinase phosphoryl donor subunit DhaM [Agromyces kandeliae]|uniref:Phosphocarrier protein HPr n=1 Tax=Agromyces kandeliae TaxID=2666141 RepID=A0A6L5R4K3_9MICO|nr:dihydroxyacetone kinase phosphoryl donor subunit DhaM [Agromyces kandeliae]MRX44825.1 HPr family phosphocarrier protein [Agromyces kandeliae]
MADGDRIGIVVVSHSEKLAAGVIELAHQMAPNVRIEPAGGTDDGRIGTSFERVTTAIGAADAGAGVVVLCDLGSAILTAETAMDFLDDDVRQRVRIADAPLVEGTVAASVAAESGDPLEGVVRAAESAGGGGTADLADVPAESAGASDDGSSGEPISRRITLTNSDGLHARPAAELVKLASTFPQRVTVNGIDAKSLLAIMALGLVKGDEVEIATEDPAGAHAVEALAELAASGFGEH